MYQNLDLFRVAGQMAAHAGTRQASVAMNVANADTPGYRASHVAPFSESYRADTAGRLKRTRPGHMVTGSANMRPNEAALSAEPSPNGNSVSLEQEMLESVDAAREHSRALAIYRHSMTIIRSTIGPMK